MISFLKNMVRRKCLTYFLTMGGTLLESARSMDAAETNIQRKPNVLFIAVDDMNDWIGCHNTTPAAITPNIDRLAKRGVNFTNAHTAGVFCAPSRATIFSGQFASATPHHHHSCDCCERRCFICLQLPVPSWSCRRADQM